jgi:sugar diacid utilization regulator
LDAVIDLARGGRRRARRRAAGGALTATLLEYAAAHLNAKVAAQRLYIHVNTANHRLARIEEKTACDLRSLTDVQELLIAVKIAAGR